MANNPLDELFYGPGGDLIPHREERYPVEFSPEFFVGPRMWDPAEVAATQQPSMIGGALRRGTYYTGTDFANTAGMIAEGLGANQIAEGIYAKSREWEQAAKAIPRRIQRIEDASSWQDYGVFMVEQLFETAPMLAAIAIPGTAFLKVGTKAATAAAFLSDLGLQTGESVRLAREAGKDPVDFRVVGSGIGKAILDFFPYIAVAGRLGLGPMADTFFSKFLVDGGYIKRVAGSLALIEATEVPTEVAQEGINVWLSRALKGEYGELTQEEKSQLLNAGAGAAALGLLAPIAGFSRGGARSETIDLSAEESEANVARATTVAAEGERAAPERAKPATIIIPKENRWRDDGLIQYLDVDIGATEAAGSPVAKLTIVDRGNVVEVYKGKLKVAEAPDVPTAKAVAEKSLSDSPKAFVTVRSDGKLVTRPVKTKDPMKVEAEAILVAGGPRTLPEVAIVALNRGREAAEAQVTPKPSTVGGAVKAALIADPFTPLKEQADKILSNPGNIRTTDGQLKVEAQKKLDSLVTRADAVAKQTGKANPLKDSVPVGTNAELAAEEASAPNQQEGNYPNLTEAEIALYKRLTETESVSGLPPAGYEKLETLISKMRGEPETPRRKVRLADTPEYAEALAIIEKERKRETRAAKPRIKKEKGLTDRELDALLSSKDDGWQEIQGELKANKGEVLRQNGHILGLIRSRSDRTWDAILPQGGLDAEIATVAQFSSAEAARDWIERETGYGSLTLEQALEALNSIIRRLRYGPRVVLVSSRDPSLREKLPHVAALSQRSRGTVGAYYTEGEHGISTTFGEEEVALYFPEDGRNVYLFYDRHTSTKDLIKTYLHEALAHFGLRAFYTEAELKQIFQQILDTRRAEVILHASRRYGEVLHKGYILSTLDVEEFVATKAEDGTDIPFLQRMYAFFRRGLRKLGIELTWTDEDIRYMLAGIRQYLTTGVTDRYRGSFSALEKGGVPLQNVVKFEPKWRTRQDPDGRRFWTYGPNIQISEIFDANGNKTFLVQAGDLMNEQEGYFSEVVNTIGDAKKRAEDWWIQLQLQRDGKGFTGGMSRLTGLNDDDVSTIKTGLAKSAELWKTKLGLSFLSTMQIAEQFGKGVANGYIEQFQRWWGEKRALVEPSLELAKRWATIGKDNGQRLANALVDISMKSDAEGRALTSEEKAKIYGERGVTGELFKLAEEIFGDFRRIANLLEEHLLKGEIQRATRDAVKTERFFQAFKKGSDAFTQAVIEDQGLEVLNLPTRLEGIVAQMAILKNRDYFPRMRFGRYALTIRAKEGGLNMDGKSFKSWTVVEFATFDTLQERAEALGEVKRVYKGANAQVQVSILKDEEFDLLGMPPALYDTLKEHLKLTPQQTLMLTDLYYKHSPGKAFLRHLLRRKNTKGFSMDALRSYTAYMMKAANHVARAKYATPMTQELEKINAWGKQETDADRASLVADYFNKHYKDTMSPGNDWAQLRSFGFLFHLGFNVKSALVNLTQIPMVAYPYLGANYGDAKAMAALLKAIKLVMEARTGKSFRNAALAEDVKRGIMQGFLDESQASMLAGYAEGDVLHRLIPFSPSLTTYNRFAYYGAYLFQNAEVLNREITFTAAWLLARDKGAATLGANEYELSEAGYAGRDAVQSAMFEYARWQRPKFMQGKRSVFFLFWSYMQNMAYLSFGGKGGKVALRVWLSLLLAAGIQGLPFAENILDLFDLFGTEIKEALGLPDPKVALRNDIRSLARTLTDNPDIIMHGLGRYYGLGLAHLFGAPNFDISGSLSLGRIVPGMDVLAREYRNPNEKFGRMIVEVFGPVMAIPYNIWKAVESDDPDKFKVWERAYPAVLAQASKALRRHTYEAELLRGSQPLIEFDPNNLQHRLENIGQAFGLTPTRLAKAFERNAVQQDMVTYWKTRRAMVMENFAFARLSEDQEARADALESRRKFNEQAPSPTLRISGDDLIRSINQRIRRRSLREHGLPPERAFVPLYSALDPLYPQDEP